MEIDLATLPLRMHKLPVDSRGYPVPWFVEWVESPSGPVPDFRVADMRKWRQATKERLCWVCGEKLGRWLAFLIGPMCVINRVTSEPPTHRECAEWSLHNCPFLAQPRTVRRDENLPPGAQEPAGFALLRNPGVMCLWITRDYNVFRVPPNAGGTPGQLITIGEPEHVTWWRESRPATRAEVEESIAGGMPSLLAAAQLGGRFAVEAFGEQVQRAQQYLPLHGDPLVPGEPDPSVR